MDFKIQSSRIYTLCRRTHSYNQLECMLKKNTTAIRIVFLTIKIKTFVRNVILNTEKK